MNLIYVFIGGGLGSMARYGMAMLVASFYRGAFPYATLISNFLSCTIFGIVFWLMGEKFNTEASVRLLLITGFCGGFSTFSAFSFETVELIRSGYSMYALLNVLASVLVCFGIIWLFLRNAI